jgi:hypothetical protein
MWKEILLTVAAVIIGLIVYNMLAKKIPILKGSYDEFEADYDGYEE